MNLNRFKIVWVTSYELEDEKKKFVNIKQQLVFFALFRLSGAEDNGLVYVSNKYHIKNQLKFDDMKKRKKKR